MHFFQETKLAPKMFDSDTDLINGWVHQTLASKNALILGKPSEEILKAKTKSFIAQDHKYIHDTRYTFRLPLDEDVENLFTIGHLLCWLAPIPHDLEPRTMPFYNHMTNYLCHPFIKEPCLHYDHEESLCRGVNFYYAQATIYVPGEGLLSHIRNGDETYRLYLVYCCPFPDETFEFWKLVNRPSLRVPYPGVIELLSHCQNALQSPGVFIENAQDLDWGMDAHQTDFDEIFSLDAILSSPTFSPPSPVDDELMFDLEKFIETF